MKTSLLGSIAAMTLACGSVMAADWSDTSLALSHGTGEYNHSAVTGTATVAGKISDTTLGLYYSFDKATSAYVLTSMGKNTPSVTTGAGATALDAGYTGESQTSTIGLRYNY